MIKHFSVKRNYVILTKRFFLKDHFELIIEFNRLVCALQLKCRGDRGRLAQWRNYYGAGGCNASGPLGVRGPK
jgi:hypothetical protein